MSSVRPEYPRPQFDRSHSWRSLNGEWDFHRDPASTAILSDLGTAAWGERIAVPFAWETPASGIGAQWLETGWYRRAVVVPREWAGQRAILHFGAVHHAAAVWVNGIPVGEHEGGYTPFELDITDALDDGYGVIAVRVAAPLDKRFIVHGKQRSIPADDYDNCSFTPSSGIWQPVWLEARPATWISAVNLVPGADLASIDARVEVRGALASGASIQLVVDGEEPVELTANADGQAAASLPVRDPRLWSPTDPHLYYVHVEAASAHGVDAVTAYTGLRSIAVDGESLLLNGGRLYVRGVLDQGYWPGTGITAPTDEAFVTDIDIARRAGFTAIRKHLKLEDPRFHYHADRMGMLVWAEPASTGRFSAEGAARFEAQIEPMVERDGNHPSIVIWGLYNEEWGLDWDVAGDPVKQQTVRRAFDLLKSLDSIRPAVDNSGWSHVSTDIVDWHIYDETPIGWAAKLRRLLGDHEATFPVGIGPGIVVDKPVMATEPGSDAGKPNLNSEFGGGFTSVERGWNQRWQTLELRSHDQLSGYVWTELYDIEHEMAGLYDAERVLKDSGGSVAVESNADTVLVPSITPERPGRDLVAEADGAVAFDVRISHHGPSAVDGEIVAVWGAQLGAIGRRDLLAQTRGSRASADPFLLGSPVRIVERMPDGAVAARLHLGLVSDDDLVATVAIDVTR